MALQYSPRSLPSMLLSSILIAILILSLDHSHQHHKTSSILFVSGFSSSSTPVVKVASYNHHALKGSQQSQFSNRYNQHQLWSSSAETTSTESSSSSSSTIPKVKAVKQKKKSTKKYTKKKYKKGGYKKKNSFYKSNFPGKFISLLCDVYWIGWLVWLGYMYRCHTVEDPIFCIHMMCTCNVCL